MSKDSFSFLTFVFAEILIFNTIEITKSLSENVNAKIAIYQVSYGAEN